MEQARAPQAKNKGGFKVKEGKIYGAIANEIACKKLSQEAAQ